ncbi:hypothetical protein Dcar01_03310 [Deinococcus carri]|uniref:Globin n=1 Tax=Deinococcus carri TaxID=1211323 RepID=A0ABP9WB37_9DEIO
MNPTEPTFNNIQEQFRSAFPELRAAYGLLAADAVFSHDGQPSQYALIEQLFAVYIEVLLALPESPLRDAALHKSFVFVEKMLAAPDKEVVGLAQIGLIEGREQWWFQRALPFVGPLWRVHASRMGEPCWQAAVAAGATAAPAPERTIDDLFGVRQAIAGQLAPEGIILSEVPGTTVG